MAILCTPEQSVPNLLEQLRSTGVIRGVLNFTPTPLRSDEQFCVQNIDIRMELEKLFCLIHFDKHRRGTNDVHKKCCALKTAEVT